MSDFIVSSNYMKPEVPSSPSNWSRICFIAGCVVLFFMALFWSVDKSLISIFVGVSVFFFFLSYFTKPQIAQPDDRYQQPPPINEESLFTLFQKMFVKNGGPSSQPVRNTDQRVKAITMTIFIFGMVIFFIVMVGLISSGSDSYSDNFVQAEQFRLDSKYDSAKIYYHRVLADEQENVPSHIGLGNVFLSENNYDSSRYYFTKAISLDEDSEEARYGKALGYYYQKDYRSSLKESFALLKRSPEHSDGVLLTGDNYYSQERYDSAMYYYEGEYARGTRTAGLSHVMAFIYDTKGQQEKAIGLYKETLSMDSTRVGIYDRLSELEPNSSVFYKVQAKKWRDAGYGN
jgi:tetratricopeptide (TPR) repeat protein